MALLQATKNYFLEEIVHTFLKDSCPVRINVQMFTICIPVAVLIDHSI